MCACVQEIADLPLLGLGLVGGGQEGAVCDAADFLNVLQCAPPMWAGFPFGTPKANFSDCRRTALEGYMGDYRKCYEKHSCAAKWTDFCESKKKEWKFVCNHETLDRTISLLCSALPPVLCRACLLFR
eukprot:COSAG05_NODE_465_length_9537_cov_21.527086_8_plen_128_part_00